MGNPLQKIEVRNGLKRIEAGFSEEYVEKTSDAVSGLILQSREFRDAKAVFGFLSFGHEISVDRVLLEALRLGKLVAVPHIISATEMLAARLESLQDLPLDRYGIRTTPEPVTAVPPDRFDLVLVPGTGFTPEGCRMGRGAGYYDRFLERVRGVTLGVTSDRLLLQELPVDDHDRKVDMLVTETGLIRCNGK